MDNFHQMLYFRTKDKLNHQDLTKKKKFLGASKEEMNIQFLKDLYKSIVLSQQQEVLALWVVIKNLVKFSIQNLCGEKMEEEVLCNRKFQENRHLKRIYLAFNHKWWMIN